MYLQQVLNLILDEIKSSPGILAIWEGGSLATETQDKFSDLDLCVLASVPQRQIIFSSATLKLRSYSIVSKRGRLN